MELWFSEVHTPDVKLGIRVSEQLYSGKSEYQQIDVFQTCEFGRLLAIDGITMMTEKDEFVYHEMLVHVPMAINPTTQNVLVIGAGDGGIIRELVKYAGIKHIDMVEIDKMVVDVSREFLPATACSLDDPRLTIHYQDGLRFVRKYSNKYDLVIVDSTDPFGPGEGLFTKEFYGNVFNALTDDGIMVNQLGGAFYQNDILSMQRAFSKIKSTFPIARAYQADIPTYPGGNWLLGFGAKNSHPIRDLKSDEWQQFGVDAKCYNTRLHMGAFALPNHVLKLIEEA